MGVYPGANYRPLNQFSNTGTKPRLGVVLHVNDSDGPSLYNWIAGNNDMSCHWQVAKDGTVEQYIDTDNGSWCQMDGNDTYMSIETQGFPTEALTDAQVQACAGIMKWVHEQYGIPLQIADSVGQAGFGWHGMGGAAWGGHTGCPGDLRKAQRKDILALAAGENLGGFGTMDDATINAKFDEVKALVRATNKFETTVIDPKTGKPKAFTGTVQGTIKWAVAPLVSQIAALRTALAAMSTGTTDLAAVEAAAKKGADEALNEYTLSIVKAE